MWQYILFLVIFHLVLVVLDKVVIRRKIPSILKEVKGLEEDRKYEDAKKLLKLEKTKKHLCFELAAKILLLAFYSIVVIEKRNCKVYYINWIWCDFIIMLLTDPLQWLFDKL
jgi:hypothetical protein